MTAGGLGKPCVQGQSGAALHILGTPLFLTLGFLEYIQSETPVKKPPKKTAISICHGLPMECPHGCPVLTFPLSQAAWQDLLAPMWPGHKDRQTGQMPPNKGFCCPPGPGGTGQLMWVSLTPHPQWSLLSSPNSLPGPLRSHGIVAHCLQLEQS